MIRTKENDHLFKYDTNKQIRASIDKCLHQINANRAQYLGTDSTQEDIAQLQALNEPLRVKIKELDPELYDVLYPNYAE